RLTFELHSIAAAKNAPSGLPPDVPRWPYIAWGTAESWASVAARYRSILDESVSAGGAEALLEGIPEDLSKKELAAALKLVVDRQIRYTGIEFGDASYIPRSPAETMQRR